MFIMSSNGWDHLICLTRKMKKKKDLPETFGNYKDMESLQNYFVDKNL